MTKPPVYGSHQNTWFWGQYVKIFTAHTNRTINICENSLIC
jgi:hypothetical protein